jgi:hypothetical protein
VRPVLARTPGAAVLARTGAPALAHAPRARE